MIIGLVFDYFGLPIVWNYGQNSLVNQQLLFSAVFLSIGLSLTIVGVILTAFGYSEKTHSIVEKPR